MGFEMKKDVKTVGTLLPATLINLPAGSVAEQLKQDSKYLPRLKIYWPIEATPYTGKACIVAGDDVTVLAKPYHLASVFVRNAVRAEVTNDSGEKKFEMAYQGGRTAEKFASLPTQANAKADKGKSVLVVVLPTADKCVVAVADLFKTMEPYLGKVLRQGVIQNKSIVRVDVLDHMVNTVASKKDVKNKYFSADKFTQFEQLELTDSQAQLIEAAIKANEDLIQEWLIK